MFGRDREQRNDRRGERSVRNDDVDAYQARTRGELAALAAVAAALAAFFLSDFVAHGWRFPLGPDGPVYLWWMRLAGHDGLSAVPRPGVPAISLTLAGTLHLSPVAVTAGLECAIGVGVGLSAVALVRAVTADRATWILAGVLSGTFAVHLAAGYLATLAFAALFLAAAALLAQATRRASIAAALLLGAAGFAHPLFFPLGVLILAIAAAQAFREEPAETKRIALVTLGGGALLGAGILALLAGPGPLAVDTSKDGFLRRAGLMSELRHAYLDRSIHRWTRYVEWASLPLAVAGRREAGGFVGRFLRAWGITLVLGVGLSLATGLAPADRFITFGFVVPILSAFGVIRLWRALSARRGAAVAILATGALVAAMIAGSTIAWLRQAPFMSELEVARSTTAAAYAAATPPGTPLVFLVNDADATVTFLETRAANVIRATMLPDRIRDVVIVVPPANGPVPADRAALSRLTAADAAAAVRGSGKTAATFVVVPFDRVDPAAPHLVAEGVAMTPAVSHPVASPDTLLPSNPAGIVLATVAIFALLSVVGFGWSRAVSDDPLIAFALAPAVGAAALILTAIVAERLGVPLTGAIGPAIVSAVAGGGGYVARFLLQGRAASQSTS